MHAQRKHTANIVNAQIANCKLQIGNYEISKIHQWGGNCRTVVYFWVEFHNFKLRLAICPFTILPVYVLEKN